MPVPCSLRHQQPGASADFGSCSLSRTGLDAFTSDLPRGFPRMANCEEAGFNLLGCEVAPVITEWQACQCQSQRKQVKELLVFSLNVAGICHVSLPKLKSLMQNGLGDQFAEPVGELSHGNQSASWPSSHVLFDDRVCGTCRFFRILRAAASLRNFFFFGTSVFRVRQDYRRCCGGR